MQHLVSSQKFKYHYRFSSNVGITEKRKSLRTGQNHFVTCCLYVTF